MTRIVLFSIAIVTNFTMLAPSSAQESGDVNTLDPNISAIAKGDLIAFFGDSITQAGAKEGRYCRLIGDGIEKQHPDLGVKFIYAGISGHKVPDLQRRLDRDVLSKKPTLVFIYIGINDVWHSQKGRGTPKDEFENGLWDLIKRITETDAKIVLCTPSTIGEKTDGSNKLDQMLEEYSAISRKVATDTGVTLCDMRREFIDHLKKRNPENKERGILPRDGVHLNANGNQFVAIHAAVAIEKALRTRDVSATYKPRSLFNGKDLTGWHVDVPHLDKNPTPKRPLLSATEISSASANQAAI